ncbi:MAG: hypothetical protein OSB43_06585 [Nocardioides sp.]|uniref:hypothetical protein n=1 Tax=Nocardioides sp. TaxID=35761 RepID=UPI00238FA3C8|nr:hypothetical protein [Nocardioides sp.]MDE0775919.1 hypothetical protein [Nocardioides sp.]
MAGKSVTHTDEWWELLAPKHVLRCTANYSSRGKKAGRRCGRVALPGTNVCGTHGGLVPAVQARAAARIGMSVDDSVAELLRLASDPEVEARVRAKIYQDMLDRGGLGATSKVLVGIGPADPVETLFRDLFAAEGVDAFAPVTAHQVPALPEPDPAQEAVDRGEDPYSDIVDAELVPEPTPPRTQRRTARGRRGTEAPGTPRHIREALERLL